MTGEGTSVAASDPPEAAPLDIEVAGDEVAGDKVAGDEVAGDEVAGDEASGTDADTVRVEPDGEGGVYPAQAPPSDEFGWEGWVVVGVLVFSFLVVPPAIIYLPEAQDVVRSLGLTLRDAYLALPMLPAILLGVVAVWAAVRHRRRRAGR